MPWFQFQICCRSCYREAGVSQWKLLHARFFLKKNARFADFGWQDVQTMEELVMGKQMKYGTIVWMDRSHVVGTKSDLFIRKDRWDGSRMKRPMPSTSCS